MLFTSPRNSPPEPAAVPDTTTSHERQTPKSKLATPSMAVPACESARDTRINEPVFMNEGQLPAHDVMSARPSHRPSNGGGVPAGPAGTADRIVPLPPA